MGLSFRCLALLFSIYILILKTMEPYGKKKALEKWRALQIPPYNLEDIHKTFQYFWRILKWVQNFT